MSHSIFWSPIPTYEETHKQTNDYKSPDIIRPYFLFSLIDIRLKHIFYLNARSAQQILSIIYKLPFPTCAGASISGMIYKILNTKSNAVEHKKKNTNKQNQKRKTR